MIFEATPLQGLFVVKAERLEDDRGFFSRLYCENEFRQVGINFKPSQVSISFNVEAHTLRGLHWQQEPSAEIKLVRPTSGAIFDVAVDISPSSPTHRKWYACELKSADMTALLIPKGFAHGFLTLTPQVNVEYLMDAAYAPTSARGARFDDPAFGISWPAQPKVISKKDLSWNDYR